MAIGPSNQKKMMAITIYACKCKNCILCIVKEDKELRKKSVGSVRIKVPHWFQMGIHNFI